MFSNQIQASTSYNISPTSSHNNSDDRNNLGEITDANDGFQQAHRPTNRNATTVGSEQRHQPTEQHLFMYNHFQLDSDAAPATTISNFTTSFFHQPVLGTTQTTSTNSLASSATTTTAAVATMTNQNHAHRPLARLNYQPHSMDQINSQHLNYQHQLNQVVASQQNSQFDNQQHLTCVNVMNADNLTNHLANAGHVIFDQTNGLLRIGSNAGVLNAASNQATIVVNTISELRHQQQSHNQTTIPPFAICDVGNVNDVSVVHYNNNCPNVNTDNSYGTKLNPRLSELDARKSGADASTSITNNNGANLSKSNSSSNSNCLGKTNVSSVSSYSAHCQSQSKIINRRRTNSKKSETNNQPNSAESKPRRTFACPTCSKEFTEKFNMKRHMQVHSQSRPKYICNECSKSFAWKDNFIRHKKAAHNTNVHPSFPI